jgi:hypothetical protein
VGDQIRKVSGVKFYVKYLAKGEAHVAQAEDERSDTLLIRLLYKTHTRVTIQYPNPLVWSSVDRGRERTRLWLWSPMPTAT